MTQTARQADHPIEPQFLDRWSPRAFDGSAIDRETMMTLFEAARWAPSAFNSQPWRFLYAHRDTAEWAKFLSVLVPFNQSWAKEAGALVLIVSDTMLQQFPGAELKPSHSHSFDAGSAWALLALQASRMGLFTHGMTGVDFDAARAALAVPERFRIECAVAIGRIGDPASLPESLRGREAPSPRRVAIDSAFEGSFPATPG